MTAAEHHEHGRQLPDPSVTLRPQARGWAAILAECVQLRPAAAAEFRRQMGLPVDGPVLMTGHQAEFWHPGILAKYLAADALAGAARAHAAWLVVDQDVGAPGLVRAPVRRSAGPGAGGGGGRSLRVETWIMDPAAARAGGDVPTSRQRPLRVGPAPTLDAGEAWAGPGVVAGMEAMRAALSRHAGAASAAGQVAGAVGDLLRPLVGTNATTVMATAVSRTALFAAVVDRMRSDPGACVRAYNAAVAAHPRERVQPLGPEELPLWSIEGAMGSARRRVSAGELPSLPTEQLAPRALLMTGLFRWAGCDLFIHGTGGGGAGSGAHHEGYDRITEEWLGSWLGSSLGGSVRLAPVVVATATLRLRIGHAGPGPEELRLAQWTAHRARHDPNLLDDEAAAAEKRAWVLRIADARRRRGTAGGGDARALYREMHAMLASTRAAHTDRLARLDHAAAIAAAGLGDAEIAGDRTWAFPLYEPEQIRILQDRVAQAF